MNPLSTCDFLSTQPKIALENIVLEAQQHEATVNRVKTMTMLKTEEHVNFSQEDFQPNH